MGNKVSECFEITKKIINKVFEVIYEVRIDRDIIRFCLQSYYFDNINVVII